MTDQQLKVVADFYSHKFARYNEQLTRYEVSNDSEHWGIVTWPVPAHYIDSKGNRIPMLTAKIPYNLQDLYIAKEWARNQAIHNSTNFSPALFYSKSEATDIYFKLETLFDKEVKSYIDSLFKQEDK